MARMSAPKTAARANIIQLKVTLRGVRPPVWRRLLMPGTMTLGQLHTAIQGAMGWRDGHLHVFDIGGEAFGDRRSVDGIADEQRPTLNGLLKSSVVRFSYTYDFGDNWEHTVAFEKSAPAVEGQSYPACVGGKRNCPPEDCGGAWGYEQLLADLADPNSLEHANQIEWIGEDFDPNEFSQERANTVLAARFERK
jgi:hypothetical protein